MMNKIILFDLGNNGHHWFYNFNLMKCLIKTNKVFYYTSTLTREQEKQLKVSNIQFKIIDQEKHPGKIKRNLNMFKIMKYIKKEAYHEKFDLIMFTYLDSMLIQLPLFLFSNVKIICTLHWFINSNIKKIILKMYLAKANHLLIVHDELIKKNINSIDDKIKVVYYPISKLSEQKTLDKAEFKLNMVLKKNLKTLLCFGETRYDKGLDIFLEALKYVKSDCNIIIAGKEETFTKEFILSKINSLNINRDNVHLDLRFIPDDITEMYFKVADIVVLPYRKMFLGQSGPLTEGIKNDCYILAPDWLYWAIL